MHFVSSWKSPFGRVEWMDAGCLATLRLRLSAPQIFSTKEEAGAAARELMERVFNLPSSEENLIKVYNFEPIEIDGKPVYHGNMRWGLRTKVDRVVDGEVWETPLEPLKWHHNIFFVTNGSLFAARVTYFDEDQEVSRKFSRKDFRFKE